MNYSTLKKSIQKYKTFYTQLNQQKTVYKGNSRQIKDRKEKAESDEKYKQIN